MLPNSKFHCGINNYTITEGWPVDFKMMHFFFCTFHLKLAECLTPNISISWFFKFVPRNKLVCWLEQGQFTCACIILCVWVTFVRNFMDMVSTETKFKLSHLIEWYYSFFHRSAAVFFWYKNNTRSHHLFFRLAVLMQAGSWDKLAVPWSHIALQGQDLAFLNKTWLQLE